MEGPWLISYIVLWCLMLALAVAVLANSRLLGLLHHRFGPAKARPLADGPEIGAHLGRVSGRRLDGSEWSWEAPAERDLLMVFISPQCKSCNDLVPHFKDFVRTEPEINAILVSVVDDTGMNRAYVAFQSLERMPFVIGEKLSESLAVEGTPYAVRLDAAGVVRAKGVVNHLEHLRSLLTTTIPPADRLPEEEPVRKPLGEARDVPHAAPAFSPVSIEEIS